jgi:ribosome-associated protein
VTGPRDSSSDLLPQPHDDELAPGVSIPQDLIRIQFSRSGGPGGQNVNKTNTKTEVWIPVAQIAGLTPGARQRLRVLAGRRLTNADELHLSAEAHRSQEQNRQDVFRRIRELILEAQPEPRRRKKTRPSKASKRRRVESKRRRSEIKSNRRISDRD